MSINIQILWAIGIGLILSAILKTHHDWKTEISTIPAPVESKIIALVSNFIHDLVVFLFPFFIIVLVITSLFADKPPSVKIIIGVNLFLTIYYLQFALAEMCSLTWIYNKALGFKMDKPYRNIFRNNQSKMERDYPSLSGTHYQNTLEWVNGNIVVFSLVGILNLIYFIRIY
jgi:flagellar biosynthesis protein FliP